MENKKLNRFIAPEQLAEFKCTGGACSYTCCGGRWRIEVDKASYLKYRSLPDSDPLKDRMQTFLRRDRSKYANENRYALIRHGVRCPFLNADNLCDIQAWHGEAWLCRTCRLYPRIDYMLDGKGYRGLSMTCEEAARLCLLVRDGVAFVEYESEEGVDTSLERINSHDKAFAFTPKRHFPSVRAFVLALLKNRSYPLWQRLVLLGMFCRALDECTMANEVPATIEKYLNIVSSGAAKDYLASLAPKPDIALGIADIAIMELEAQERDIRFHVRLGMVADMLKSEKGEREDNTWYFNLMREFWTAYLPDREHIIENFLVMTVFNAVRLFGASSMSFSDSFACLALYYSILRLFFTCEQRNRELPEKELVNICVDIAHHYDLKQSRALCIRAMKTMKELGMNTLAWYTALLCE